MAVNMLETIVSRMPFQGWQREIRDLYKANEAMFAQSGVVDWMRNKEQELRNNGTLATAQKDATGSMVLDLHFGWVEAGGKKCSNSGKVRAYVSCGQVIEAVYHKGEDRFALEREYHPDPKRGEKPYSEMSAVEKLDKALEMCCPK